MTDPDLDPLDLIIQGIFHIFPWVLTALGILVLTYYLYGDLT